MSPARLKSNKFLDFSNRRFVAVSIGYEPNVPVQIAIQKVFGFQCSPIHRRIAKSRCGRVNGFHRVMKSKKFWKSCLGVYEQCRA